jgi:ribonuclease HII
MLDNTIKIDGPKIFDLNEKTFFIKKGDQKSVSIASASIIAKCHRDEIVKKLAINHPLYQWEKNKGYGTKKHIDAIKKFGVSNLHRKSFLSKILD